MFGVLYLPQLIARCYLEICIHMGIHGRQRFSMGFLCVYWDLAMLADIANPERKKNMWHNM